MFKHHGQFHVADVVRGQWSAQQRNRIMRETAEQDARRFRRVQIWVEQEPGSGGKESAEYTIRQLAGFAVSAERVTGDKVARAAPLAAQAEGHNLLLAAAAWNRDFIDELTAFPLGRHDDQVDAASGAFNKLTHGSRGLFVA